MKYACIQRYYDNGRVTARVEEVADTAKKSHKEMKNCDVYVDIFNTKRTAERWKRDALEA